MKRSMKSCLLMGCAAGLALSLQVCAHAQVSTAVLNAAGASLDISHLFVYNPQTGTYDIAKQNVEVGKANLTLNSTVDLDPTFASNTTLDNPLPFTLPFGSDFVFTLPTVHAGSLVKSSLGVTITDGGSNGSTFTPIPVAPTNTNLALTILGNGVDLGADIGTTFNGVAGGTTTVNFAGTSFSPVDFTIWDIRLNYSLSPGDVISITYRVDIIDVPEPGTVALLVGLGVSSSAFALRRKRQAKKVA